MTITYDLAGPVAVLTLDDGKANAISPDVLDALTEALAKARAEARAVVLAGRPGMFSAGYHLPTMRSNVTAMRALLGQGARTMMELFGCPLPVVVACTGHALAAGGAFLLIGDRRIGADGDFKIGMNALSHGLEVPGFAIDLARSKVPPPLLDDVIFGEVFDPAGARRAGFLDRVVPAGDVLAEALTEATRLAELAPGAVAATKERLRGSIVSSVLATLDDDLATIPSPWSPA
jgi:enoyl-CoA hydratase